MYKRLVEMQKSIFLEKIELEESVQSITKHLETLSRMEELIADMIKKTDNGGE